MSEEVPDRHISPLQTREIKKALSAYEASKIGIITLSTSPERIAFASELADAFRSAGWTPIRGQDLEPGTWASIVLPHSEFRHAGVLLIHHNQSNMPNLAPIIGALEAAKIVHRTIELSGNITIFWFWNADINFAVPVLFIGPKTEPKPDD